TSFYRTPRSLSSLSVLSSSIASLAITGDLLEHFGLSSSYPSELHISCLYGERSKVRAFLMDKGVVNSTDAQGKTPLMYAVIGKQPKCCVMLLRSGAEVDLKDQSGMTAILLAAKYEYEDVIKVLLKNGAETHHTDKGGRTVFHLASVSENYKCLEYLCRYGSPAGMNIRDNSYRTPLVAAAQAKIPGHVQRLLMAKADLGISDSQGRTALHYAVLYNSLPCAQAIVETSPNDINLIDTAGQSALHLVCIHGSQQLLQYLLSISSCHLNLQDKTGNTALHYAAMENRLDLVKMLLSKGASVVLKNKGNITPLQCSLEMVSLNPCMIVLYSSCAYDLDSGVGRALISPQSKQFERPTSVTTANAYLYIPMVH
ncbi:Putative ankyrin repeat protein MM_0045, partial [Geodia barretti]